MERRLLSVDRLSHVRHSIINTRPRRAILTHAAKSYVDLIRNHVVQSAVARSIDAERLAAFRTAAQASLDAWRDKSYAEGFDLGQLLESVMASALFTQIGLMHKADMVSLDRVISAAMVCGLYEDFLDHKISEVEVVYH